MKIWKRWHFALFEGERNSFFQTLTRKTLRSYSLFFDRVFCVCAIFDYVVVVCAWVEVRAVCCERVCVLDAAKMPLWCRGADFAFGRRRLCARVRMCAVWKCQCCRLEPGILLRAEVTRRLSLSIFQHCDYPEYSQAAQMTRLRFMIIKNEGMLLNVSRTRFLPNMVICLFQPLCAEMWVILQIHDSCFVFCQNFERLINNVRIMINTHLEWRHSGVLLYHIPNLVVGW